ncbi:MAG: sodium:solute symporter family protein [Desulfurococcales archaeon]|nr:sodium:solute symporter family protein [Desulfurococcales archaeon]
MEERLIIELTVLLLYIFLGTIGAIVGRKYGVKTSREYYIGGGRLGTFLAALTYAATTYSSFMIVGLVGIAYFTGIGSLGFELSYYIATLLLLAILAPIIYRKSRERSWVTPSEMLGDLYGSPRLAAVIAVIYFLALLPYSSAQLKGIGETIATAGGQGYYAWGILLGFTLILAWTLLAGIWSVAITDAIQGIWMIAAAVLLSGWLVWELFSNLHMTMSTVTSNLSKAGLLEVSPGQGFWKIPVFVSFTLPWLFFAVTNPQVLQRVYMPKNEKSLRGMIIWFGLFGLLYTVIVVLIGMLARAGGVALIPFNLQGKDSVTPALLNIAPLWISVIVFVSIIAASISTVDSIILSVSSSIGHDLPYDKRKISELSVAKTTIALMAIIVSGIAYLRVSYIVQLSVLSSLFLLPLLPPTLAGLLSKEPKNYNTLSWSSIVFGLLVAILLTYYVGVSNVFSREVLGLTTPVWVFIASWAPWILALNKH